uniref:Uncharacterized protein n=1 Tax=Arcella intermedia TaxID=1963864 RepID=A0A6B2LPJ0_9EUKA
MFVRSGNSWALCEGRSIQLVSELVSYSDVYLICQVDTDEEENLFRELIRSTELVNLGFDERKILFCSSPEGRKHMVRQLSPDLHIDTNSGVIKYLQPVLPELIYITPNPESFSGPTGNVFVLKDLSECRNNN